jgi:hypothetical protein
LETALSTAVSGLQARGIDGLSVTNDKGRLAIAVDSAKLASSLNSSAASIGMAIETVSRTVSASFAEVGKNIADFMAGSAANIPADRSENNLLADQVKAKFLAARLANG